MAICGAIRPSGGNAPDTLRFTGYARAYAVVWVLGSLSVCGAAMHYRIRSGTTGYAQKLSDTLRSTTGYAQAERIRCRTGYAQVKKNCLTWIFFASMSVFFVVWLENHRKTHENLRDR